MIKKTFRLFTAKYTAHHIRR